MAYLFTHADKAERVRLAAIKAACDPITIESLEKIGVKEGWQCLEVGAGGGSMAEWLCRRVGPTGKVVATDLQTKFLEAIEFMLRPDMAIAQLIIEEVRGIPFGNPSQFQGQTTPPGTTG